MNEIYKLKSEIIALCKRYENGDFGLQELQGRLSRINRPELIYITLVSYYSKWKMS